MTAPAVQQDKLTQLLDLVDASRARTIAIEDQVATELDRVYAHHLSLYIASASPAGQYEVEQPESHPLVNTALLIAVVAVLQRAFSRGAEEGRRFAGQQLAVVHSKLRSDTIFSLDDEFMNQIVIDFRVGQRELAKEGGRGAEELTQALASRAKLAAVTAIQAGRTRAAENELKLATENWTGEVHKLWVARFDLETMPCAMCVRLHGMHVSLDSVFPEHPSEPVPYLGKIARPPRHPQCRCSTVLYLPAKMKVDKVGPTPLSMIQYADQVLELMGSDARLEFVAATVVWVRPYTRLVNGHLNFVKGYYFDVGSGRKVNNAGGGRGGGGSVSTVSVGALHTLSLPKLNGKSLPGSGSGSSKPTSGHAWGAGTYSVNLPDGSQASLNVGADGSGVASHLGKTEKVTPDGVSKYLNYWDGLGQVSNLDSAPPDPTIGKREGPAPDQVKSELLIGQKTFAKEHVASAIKLLSGEKTTSVKTPLKAADHPLANEDLRKIAEDHAGKTLHYSKLRQGVVDALQHHLDNSVDSTSADKSVVSDKSSVSADSGVPAVDSNEPSSLTDEQLASDLGSAHDSFAQVRTQGLATSSPEYTSARDAVASLEAETKKREQAARGDSAVIPDAPAPPKSSALPVSAVAPAALPRSELSAWSGVLTSAKSAFKVAPESGNRGSALAAGLQKVASTRHRYYVQVSEKDSKVSMKMLSLQPGSTDQNYMIHSNGSVWERTLDGDGAERLTPVSVGRVKQMTDSHLSSVDGITLQKALSNLHALNDSQLDKFMQHALSHGDMDAFERLSAEADRRDARDKKRLASDEQRAAAMEKLLAAGGDEEAVTEQVYGVTAEAQRRRSAISALRSEGYTGVNLTELARSAYRDYIYQLYLQAEIATNGHMLTKEGEGKNLSPLTLFSGPESRMTKYASPEMVDWFELHGRLTFKDWMNNFLGKFGSVRA